MFKIISKDKEDTRKVGYELGKFLKGGEVICLTGDLGAGKTTFTQALAEGLEVEGYVTSPTFTLINEYDGRLPLYHFDVYRINNVDEMYELGYEEYFYSEGVTVIEWANIIEDILPEDRIDIEIKRGNNVENEREIILNSPSEKWKKTIDNLEKNRP